MYEMGSMGSMGFRVAVVLVVVGGIIILDDFDLNYVTYL